MLSEVTRDLCFTTAWFGLMAFVWFGWAQEAPPRRWRAPLGIASGVGVAVAVAFGVLTYLRWDSPSALDGRYAWFGVLVAAEVLAAGAGCLVLARRGASRWMAWWVAVVVAAHFVPLAALLDDPGVAVVGFAQLTALAVVAVRSRRDDLPTSRLAGPVMGATLLVAAAIGAVTALTSL